MTTVPSTPSDPSGAQYDPPSGSAGPASAPAGPASAPTGPMPGSDLGADIGAGLTFAFTSLLRNPLALLVSGLIHSVLICIVLFGAWILAAVVYGIRGAGIENYADDPPPGDVLLMLAIVGGISLLALPVAAIWASGTARSAEVIRAGGRPTIGQALIGPGRVFLTSLLVGVITLVGLLLCIVPGLVAAVALFTAIPASARGASPVEALQESVRLARTHLGTTILGALVVGVIAYVAAWLMITMLISIPLYILFQFGLHERLNGRALPEPARA